MSSRIDEILARPFYRHFGAADLDRHWMVWPDIGALAAPPRAK